LNGEAAGESSAGGGSGSSGGGKGRRKRRAFKPTGEDSAAAPDNEPVGSQSASSELDPKADGSAESSAELCVDSRLLHLVTLSANPCATSHPTNNNYPRRPILAAHIPIQNHVVWGPPHLPMPLQSTVHSPTFATALCRTTAPAGRRGRRKQQFKAAEEQLAAAGGGESTPTTTAAGSTVAAVAENAGALAQGKKAGEASAPAKPKPVRPAAPTVEYKPSRPPPPSSTTQKRSAARAAYVAA